MRSVVGSKLLKNVRDGSPFDSPGAGGYRFLQMPIFFLRIIWCNLFSFLYKAEFFYSDKEGGVFFVSRNVTVLEGEVGAARYCAEGTICNDRRSLQIQLGVWGLCEPPSRSREAPWWGPRGEAPGSSEDTSFYSTKMGLKLMHFCPGIVVEIIRIGRQKYINISQRINFIFYTNEVLEILNMVGRCKYSWGSGGAVSLLAGPGQHPGWGPGDEAPISSEDTSFHSTKTAPKIDAFLPGYCSKNYKN